MNHRPLKTKKMVRLCAQGYVLGMVWSFAFGGRGRFWSELVEHRDILHASNVSPVFSPTLLTCIKSCHESDRCYYVTYTSDTSNCHRHSILTGRQPYNGSTVWELSTFCGPGGFTYHKEIDACMYLSSTKRTWFAARDDCQARESRLLITDFFPKLLGAIKIINSMEYWVGGHRVGGNWQWTTTKMVNMSTEWWHPGEPRGRVNCLSVWRKRGFDDARCYNNNKYVCEYP